MAKKGIVKKIIELGYDLPSQKGGIMFFRVGAQARAKDFEDMLDAMSRIEYGEFDGFKVAQVLRSHAGYFSLIEFGREYSPVLYLHFDVGLKPELSGGGKKEIDAYLWSLRMEFGIVPDEADWDPNRQCLRLWWD